MNHKEDTCTADWISEMLPSTCYDTRQDCLPKSFIV